MKNTFLALLFVLSRPGLASLVPIEFEIKCQSDQGQRLEMDLLHEHLHPMAGPHLLGIARYIEGGIEYPLSIRANAYDHEFTFQGDFLAGMTGLEEWQVRLKAKSEIFYEKPEGHPAILFLNKLPDSPFSHLRKEEIPMRCWTEDLR